MNTYAYAMRPIYLLTFQQIHCQLKVRDQMAHYAVQTYNLPLKAMETTYSYRILVRHRQECLTTATEQKHKPRRNDCKRNALAIMPVRMNLNEVLKINIT